jgi:hypothetical protein
VLAHVHSPVGQLDDQLKKNLLANSMNTSVWVVTV